MIQLRSLGECTIEAGDVRLTPAAETLFATLLVLLLESPRSVSRAELVDLIWPQQPTAVAKHRLRQTLYRLTKASAGLRLSRSRIALRPGEYTLDIRWLRGEDADVHPTPQLRDLTAPFLPGYDPTISPAFAAWLSTQRAVINSRRRRLLVRGIEVARQQGEWTSVERLARFCIELDPFNEEATLALAEVCAVSGSKTEALAIVARYLKEVGTGSSDLALPAELLRRRIVTSQVGALPRRRAARLYGRSQELSQLLHATTHAIQGQGGAVLVEGLAGLGKTRLVEELRSTLSVRGTPTLAYACQPPFVDQPFSAFAEISGALLEMRGALGCEPETRVHLKRLANRPASHGADGLPTRDAEYLSATIRRAVVDLIDAVSSEQPLVLIVDDAHWLDAESRTLFERLAVWARHKMLLMVFTWQTPWTQGERLSLPQDATRIRLAPLTEADSTPLMLELLAREGRQESATYVEWCGHVSEGNPYHMEQLASHIAGEHGESGVPPSLLELQRTRLKRLGDLARRIIQCAAILGPSSSLETLEALLRVKRTSLLDSLDELDAERLLVGAGDRILVRHQLLAQAALDELSPLARKLLHSRTAAILDAQRVADPAPGLLWEIASHWQLSGNVHQAIDVLSRCARHALEVGAPAEAIRILRQAINLELAQSDERRLLQQMVTAFEVAGEWEGLVTALERLRSLHPNHEASVVHDDLELKYHEGRWRCGFPWRQVFDDLSACAASTAASSTHRLQAATMSLMLADSLCIGEEARTWYDKLVSTMEATSQPSAEADYLGMVYHCSFGDLNEAPRAASKVVSHARRAGLVERLSRTLRHAATVNFYAGRIAEALRYGEESLSLALQHQLPGATVASATLLTRIGLGCDEVLEARRWYELGTTHLGGVRDAATIPNLLTYGAELALRTGAYDEASELIDRSDMELRANMSPRIAARQAGLRMLLVIARGECPVRPRDAAKLVGLYRRTRGHNDIDLGALATFRACEAIGRDNLARNLAGAFLARHRRDSSPLPIEIVRIAQPAR